MEVLLAVAGTCWWVACAIILGKYGKEANDAKTPHEDARNTVIVLSWIEVGLFGLTVLIALITAVNCLRKCLCCCCKDDSDDKSRV